LSTAPAALPLSVDVESGCWPQLELGISVELAPPEASSLSQASSLVNLVHMLPSGRLGWCEL